MEEQKKSKIGTQSRLTIKVSDAEFPNHYKNVMLAALSCAIKSAIGLLAKKHKVKKAAIQLLLLIKAQKGNTRIYDTGKAFNIKSMHYYYPLAEEMRIKGYLSNEIYKESGRFDGHHYFITFEGEKIINEFNLTCNENMKSFLYY